MAENFLGTIDPLEEGDPFLTRMGKTARNLGVHGARGLRDFVTAGAGHPIGKAVAFYYTPTEELEQRFGVNPGSGDTSLRRDVALRALGFVDTAVARVPSSLAQFVRRRRRFGAQSLPMPALAAPGLGVVPVSPPDPFAVQ